MMTKTSVKFELILMLMFVPREREREREATLRFGLLKLGPKLEVPVESSLQLLEVQRERTDLNINFH